MGGFLVSLGKIEKLSQNSLIIVLIILDSIRCVFCVYIYITLLKVVSHHHLSALSMSVTGFKKILDRDVSSIHFFELFFCKVKKKSPKNWIELTPPSNFVLETHLRMVDLRPLRKLTTHLLIHRS